MNSVITVNESHNAAWREGNLWYGYAYNEYLDRYVFDDTGHDLITELWSYLWKWDGN